MSNTEIGNTCRTLSWLAGALLGVLGFLFAWRSFEWGVLLSLIFGILVLFVAGWLLIRLFCVSGRAETAGNLARAAEAAEAEAAEADKKVAVVDDKRAVPEPGPVLEPRPVVEPKAKSEPEPEPAASAAGAPPRLDGPRGGKPDDLKRIKGVGPGLEKLLNGMGIYHFDQIAAWTKPEIAWVDDNLVRFKGRASRDDWVKQARTLAKGGETAFSKKVDKGSV